MERDSQMTDGRIVHHPELSEVLGTEVASPTDIVGGLFQTAIADRDVSALKSLVEDQYPTVLWGSYYNQLSPEDRNWAMQAFTD